MTELQEVLCLYIKVLAAVDLQNDFALVVKDLFGFISPHSCRFGDGLLHWQRTGLSLRHLNCQVWIGNRLCHIDVIHTVWVVWHGVLCDFKRKTPRLDVFKFYYVAGCWIDMGDLIGRILLSVAFQSQSQW